MKSNHANAEKIIEEYVKSIGYDNLDTFRSHHNIENDEHLYSVAAVATYLDELYKIIWTSVISD